MTRQTPVIEHFGRYYGVEWSDAAGARFVEAYPAYSDWRMSRYFKYKSDLIAFMKCQCPDVVSQQLIGAIDAWQ